MGSSTKEDGCVSSSLGPVVPDVPVVPVVPVVRPFFPSPITATTVLTATVSPSLTLMSTSVPAAGAGISASTLSVEISNNGSSLSTESPTFLIQRTIVPSATDSPIWCITTSVDMASIVARSASHVPRPRFVVPVHGSDEPGTRTGNLELGTGNRQCSSHLDIYRMPTRPVGGLADGFGKG